MPQLELGSEQHEMVAQQLFAQNLFIHNVKNTTANKFDDYNFKGPFWEFLFDQIKSSDTYACRFNVGSPKKLELMIT